MPGRRTWPSISPKSQEHVCVIAVLTYEYFESNDPLKLSSGNWDSMTWITHNGAAAWHNVDPVMKPLAFWIGLFLNSLANRMIKR